MCPVHTGAYVSLLAHIACHPRKTTVFILRVVPITTHTHVRLKSIGKKKHRKDNKIKERKGKKRKDKKSEKRQDKKRKQGKGKRKNVILADPRN